MWTSLGVQNVRCQYWERGRCANWAIQGFLLARQLDTPLSGGGSLLASGAVCAIFATAAVFQERSGAPVARLGQQRAPTLHFLLYETCQAADGECDSAGGHAACAQPRRCLAATTAAATATLRWWSALSSAQALLPSPSGRSRVLAEPVRRQLGAVRQSITTAASAGQPQPQPAPSRRSQPAAQQPPPALQGHSQQQQSGHEYESIRRQWHVKRTQLHHYPDEVADRIRSSGWGTSSTSSTTSSRRPGTIQARSLGSASAGEPAAGSGGGRGGQAALTAALDKLHAALEYEKKVGYVNVMGSIEQVPVADWASRQLLEAAGQLQSDPAAAHACVAAAQGLRRYAGMAAAQRQAAVAVAEAAVRQALLSLQVGGRTPAGRQGRHQSQPVAQPTPAVPLAAAQPRQQPQQPPLQQHVAAAAARPEIPASVHLPQQQQQQAPLPPLPPPADQELDAAAEEAHAEESGTAVPTPEGEEYVMSGNRRVKASTVAFRRSFAEAAAALQEASGAPSGGSMAAAVAGGEQRTPEWHRLRERRLTASAFSKAVGLFQGEFVVRVLLGGWFYGC